MFKAYYITIPDAIWLHDLYKNQTEVIFFLYPDAKIIKLTLFICFKREYLSFATKPGNSGTLFERIKIGLSPCKYDEEITLQIINHISNLL
jgi:hypothetical protein